MSTPAVKTEDLWVTYRQSKGFRGTALGLGRAHALQGITLSVPEGSVCGIIGSNGAGKSTLLKVIAGTRPPSRGRVMVLGKATLLAPGLGFRRNLTGRENIILGSLAQGLTKRQARERVAGIVELSGLGDVIDWPVHTYSSGMFSRLALSVALEAEPDLLLIDEALSAGDASFRSRIDEAVAGLVSAAGTVMIITHSFAQVRRLCERCIWLQDGRIAEDSDPERAINAYKSSYQSAPDETETDGGESIQDEPQHEEIADNGLN